MEPPVKPAISQKEYLQRYLSKSDKKQKKKKSKKPAVSSSKHLKRSVIIDDDINLSDLPSSINNEEDINLDHLGDEAPQIAGFVDERPEEVKLQDKYKSGQWKGLEAEAVEEQKSRLSDSDLDVPRTKGDKTDSKKPSKRRLDEKSDSDMDVPRRDNARGRLDKNKDGRRREAQSDSDVDVPRKRSNVDNLRKERDKNSKRRERRQSSNDSDLDVPRARKDGRGNGSNKQQKTRRESDSDLDVPRSKKGKRKYDSDVSRKKESRGKYQSDSDDYMERKKKRKKVRSDSSSNDSEDVLQKKNWKNDRKRDLNSDRGTSKKAGVFEDSQRKYREEGINDGRREKKNNRGSDSDMDVPRRKMDYRKVASSADKGSDLRKMDGRTAVRDDVSARSKAGTDEQKKRTEESDRLEKMQDGKRAGLQDAKSLKDELRQLKEREDEMYRKMDPKLLGKSAEAVVRDRKTGMRRDFEKERRINMEKAAKVAVRQKKYDKWGKGLKQVREQEERLVDMAHEMSKPLARYANDNDLERALKAQEREGDPMLDYIRSHQKDSHTIDLTGGGGVRKKYAGSFPPNRFNAAPGHRWDGVDRSNGYEQKWFEARNAKKAVAEEAWKWSSADM